MLQTEKFWFEKIEYLLRIWEWNQKDDLPKGVISAFSHFFWIWSFRDQRWPHKHKRPHFLSLLGTHCSQTSLSWNYLFYTLIHSVVFIEAFSMSGTILGIMNPTVNKTGQNLSYHYLPPQTCLMYLPSNILPLDFLLRAVYPFYDICSFSHASPLFAEDTQNVSICPPSLHNPPPSKNDAISGIHQHHCNSTNINWTFSPKVSFPQSFHFHYFSKYSLLRGLWLLSAISKSSVIVLVLHLH